MPRTGSSLPASRPWLRAFAAVAVVGASILPAACYQDPQQQMDQMQLVIDMEDAVNALNAQTAELLFAVDSLRGVVARQDTAIARLANLAGVPY